MLKKLCQLYEGTVDKLFRVCGRMSQDGDGRVGINREVQFPERSQNAMPFIPVPDTVAIDVIYDWDGQIVENTLYYKKASPTDTEIAELVDTVTAYIRDT